MPPLFSLREEVETELLRLRELEEAAYARLRQVGRGGGGGGEGTHAFVSRGAHIVAGEGEGVEPLSLPKCTLSLSQEESVVKALKRELEVSATHCSTSPTLPLPPPPFFFLHEGCHAPHSTHSTAHGQHVCHPAVLVLPPPSPCPLPSGDEKAERP